MAKRKRLTVPTANPNAEGTQIESSAMPFADASQLKANALKANPLATPAPEPRRAPIADIAGEAAATSALEKVAGELTAAKRDGRMVQVINQNAIQQDYLSRDRIVMDADELDTLKNSILKRGQQTPIELMDIGNGDYGLISGYRRLQAMRDLAVAGHIDPTILALVRSPDQSSDAYVAMVEENEIRVGLSYFERANIVREAVRAGVFISETVALNELFGAVSRSKRSKIKSFLPIVGQLKDALKFPQALTERVGLSLSTRFAADDTFGIKLRDRLRKSEVHTAAEEAAILSKAADSGVVDDRPAPVRSGQPSPQAPVAKPDALLLPTPHCLGYVGHAFARNEPPRPQRPRRRRTRSVGDA
ncbi:MAG: ParB/RepB/Spo0J family partition protein, partial [Planktomarina sp.]